ncbi:phage tail tape measure protein [Streptomyces sp. ME01-18h]|uniref:phage tail tape measure protein n=1 Tax=Streptomyces sp. ME01-18h TaxID=462920 RepID=UPI0029BE8793|nr:phage tail tape measure protein [Streptomyces sp. ME01-18h]MDX3400069.1 phage tail tape measure protein [Streptomyces sp. ME01-18h]
MALTVGELRAFLTVDDRAVDPALRRAEQALRGAGQTMSGDADRAGQRAGQQLGEGLVRGADGQWRNLRGDLVDAATAAIAEAEAVMRRGGQRMGRRLGDGLDDTARQAGNRAGDALGDGLRASGEDGAEQASQSIGNRLGAHMKLAAAGVGAAAGAMLLAAFGEALDQSTITAKLGAQLDLTGPQAQMYGKAAGQLYTSAIVDTFEDGAAAIRAVAGSGLIPPEATNRQIQSIAANAADLAGILEVDVAQAAQAAGAMVRNGLAKNGKEAFDLLVKGSKGLGAAGEDLAETFAEYSPIFREAGLSGKTAMGLIRQAIQGGWSKDTDKIADAFKELQLRVGEGAKPAVASLQALGLNYNQVIEDMRAGGARGEHAMDQVADKLRELGPTSGVAKQAVKDLFGGPGEDLGAVAYALDVDKASKSMDGAAGAADRYGKALRDNAGTRVKQFQRGLQQGVVGFLGSVVIPGMEAAGKKLGGLWDQATKGMDGASLAAKLSAFVPMLGDAIASKVATVGPRIAEGLAMAGSRAAEWAMANPTAFLKVALLAAAFLAAIAFLPELLIAGVAATVSLIIGGFVAKLIQGANEKLPEWGNAVKAWFGGLWSTYVSGPISRTWNSLVSSVKALPVRTVGALAALGSMLASAASRHWQRFRDSASQKATAFIGWVRGLPGMISRGIGSLGSLLYGKGTDVVRGLWNGIRSMGSWLKSTLIGWAKDLIPGPIAKALGISSPSKVMAKDVGRWIPAGIAKGIQDNAGVVDRTMSNLVDTPSPSMAMSSAVSAAAGGSGADGGTRPIPTVRLDGGSELGDALVALIRKRVGANGGNVQIVLGR